MRCNKYTVTFEEELHDQKDFLSSSYLHFKKLYEIIVHRFIHPGQFNHMHEELRSGKLITIKELAKMIGVSPTTVSNVIRGKTNEVSQQTIEKVQKVLKEVNYIPNMTAINLAKNSSNVIGYVMNAKGIIQDNAVQDFFTGELIGALEMEIRKAGYYMMIYISDDIDEIIKFVSSWNVDGLIALGFNHDNAQKLREVYQKPLVFIDGHFYDDGNEYNNVGLEDYKGAYEMTNYLIECGHKRMGFLANNYIGINNERYRGFKEAIKNAGLPEEAGEKFFIEKSGEGIKRCMDELMKRISDFSALFFISDNCAVVAMDYLMDNGIRIPEDISVVGYDDAAVASLVRPKLTTVRQNPTQKARVAFAKLMKLINDPNEKGSL